MNQTSRIFLFGALTLILLSAACAAQEGTPTPLGTVPGVDQTGSPPALDTETPVIAETAATATTEATETPNLTETVPATQVAGTTTTGTPSIPVTGADVILLECQFCIEGMGHALLVIPETSTFEVVTESASLSTPGPEMGCNTIDTFAGRQIVLCRGEENTSLTLNICANGNDCTQLLVELQSCPVKGTPQPGPTDTLEVSVPTNTPAGTSTSSPTP